MRLRFLMAIVLVALLAALASAEPAREPLTPEETEAVRAACRAILTALANNDRVTLQAMRPTKLENRYGPPMFAEIPKLDTPKVNAHRARVDFTVKPSDPSLPRTGTIVLVLLDDRPAEPWQVSQIFWYERDKLPAGLQLPSRSVTAADQAQEPKVLAAARRYAEAWLKRDYKTVDYLTYDWIAHKRKPYTSVQLRSLQVGDPVASGGGEVRVNYAVELTVYRVFVRHLEGWVYAMREEGQWKVRPFNLVF